MISPIMRLLPLLAALPICTSFITPSAYYKGNININPPPTTCLSASIQPSSLEIERHCLQKTTTTSTRRDVLFGATTTAASLMAAVASSIIMIPTDAAIAEETSVAVPKTKAVVTLNLSIARGPSRPLRIELFQDAPAASVQFFTSLAEGTLKAPCAMGDNPNIEICEDYQSIDVGYKGSQLWRMVPGKRMDFGRVDSMFTSRIPPTIAIEDKGRVQNNEHDSIYFKPSTRGAVSIKRGGGAFEFTVTPSNNPNLDSPKEDLVVVGRIATEDMAFIDEINDTVPVRKDIVKVGDVPPLGSKFARACDFTAPDSTCAQFKPLKKIVVTDSSVVAVGGL